MVANLILIALVVGLCGFILFQIYRRDPNDNRADLDQPVAQHCSRERRGE